MRIEVGAARVPDGGDPGEEGGFQVLGPFVEPVGEGRLDAAHEVDVAEHDVRVAIEQPGQQDPVGKIDRLVSIETGSHVGDPAVLDHDVGG